MEQQHDVQQQQQPSVAVVWLTVEQAWENGLFCEFGTGAVDFAAVLGALPGYEGWAVVEQDRVAVQVDDLPVVKHKELQQREFLGCQFDRSAGATHPLCIQIHLEIRHTKRFRQWRSAPARQRSHARQQLAEGKRLGEVVVGADFEARDPVVDRITRGEHENRCRDLARPELAAKIESTPSRQHDVQNHDVESAEQRFHFAVGIIGDGYNLDAVLGESCFDDRREARIVLNE